VQQNAQPNLDGKYAGDAGFDPLGFSNIPQDMMPQIIPSSASMAHDPLPTLYWLRESELKHGRLAMLAVVGFIAVDLGVYMYGFTKPGTSSVAAHDLAVANGGMGVLLLIVGTIELLTSPVLGQAAKGSGREPGDFMLDPFGWTAKAEAKARLQLSEVTHARLAMLAFAGMVTQAVAVSDKFPYFNR
jgi:light-harvesting complex I chlorophyll a/b binding protein 1